MYQDNHALGWRQGFFFFLRDIFIRFERSPNNRGSKITTAKSVRSEKKGGHKLLDL